MMNADIEIGVVADQAGHVHAYLALPDEMHLQIVAITLVGQYLRQAATEGAVRFRAPRQPCVEDRLREVVAPFLVEKVGGCRKIEDVITDCDARPPQPLGFGKDAERQVLHRKIAARLRTVHPAYALHIMRFIDHRYESFAFGKPVQARS